MKHHTSFLLVFVAALSAPSCRETAPAPVKEVPTPAQAAPAPAATLEARPLGATARLHVLGDLYLASQPAQADFALAKDLGIRTVLDLRKPGELTGMDERAVVEGLGLAYLNLPIGGAPELDDANLDRARELLRSSKRPLLMHCASASRVGAVWVPYRVLDCGIELEAALVEARTVGLKSPELEARAREYVERHARAR